MNDKCVFFIVFIDVVVIMYVVCKLEQGGLVVFLIEIVYGFGGDVENLVVIVVIYVVKGCFVNYLVIVYVLLEVDIGYWVVLVLVEVCCLIVLFWFGLFMLILKCVVYIFDVVVGGQDLVGVCCFLYLVV